MLRVGVIGTGKFAEVCHVAGLQSHPKAQIVALCGRRTEHTKAMAERLRIPSVYADYHELCERPDIDAVTIATANVEHAQQAITALACGKHVFCEKPLATSVSEATEMLRAAEVSGKIHQVAFTYRYLYGVRELRRRVWQGDIGQPYHLRIRYECWDGMDVGYQIGFRDQIKLAGGGMLYDMGCHMFDLARFLFGPIEYVTGFSQLVPRQRVDSRTGQSADVETDDIAGAFFVHQNGIQGQWFASRVTPTPSHGDRGCIEVVGPEGALKAALSRGTIDALSVSRPTSPSWESLPLPEGAQDGTAHCLRSMMENFVDGCHRGKLDGDVDASFYDGLAAQHGVAAVQKASLRSNWIAIRPLKG